MAHVAASLPRRGTSPLAGWPLSALLALAGLLAMAIPTFISIGRDYWTTEEGVHGPIILATGIWLIFRERQWLAAEARPMTGPGQTALWLVPFLFLAVLWVFARIFAIQSAESGSLYLLIVTTGFAYLGPRAMKRLWFPVVYMAFLIVPPGSLIVEITQPLKIWISQTAVSILSFFGYPMAHTGAVIQVGQYQLLVATACAGLMSIFSLTAIGLLYVHLNWNSNATRAAVLLLAIVPIAIFANLVRVIILVLLTYHAGSSVAQGFMHEAAGLVTFSVALACMFLADAVLGLFFRQQPGPPAAVTATGEPVAPVPADGDRA